jgi:hypothetical protein
MNKMLKKQEKSRMKTNSLCRKYKLEMMMYNLFECSLILYLIASEWQILITYIF